jgi:hypothetical protein
VRKEATVVIEADGRDHGKVYKIREMSASAAEAWGTRLILALSRAGVDVPENFFGMGMAGVAVMGLKAMGGLSWDVAKPLLDEMMACVQIAPDLRHPQIVRVMNEDDIEEVATRLLLRDEVVRLHINFSVREFLSNFRKVQEARAAAEMTESGEPTETSEPTSEP